MDTNLTKREQQILIILKGMELDASYTKPCNLTQEQVFRLAIESGFGFENGIVKQTVTLRSLAGLVNLAISYWQAEGKLELLRKKSQSARNKFQVCGEKDRTHDTCCVLRKGHKGYHDDGNLYDAETDKREGWF